MVLWVKNSPVLCEAISVPVRLYSTEKCPRWTSFTSLSRAQDSLIARYLRGKRYSLERICIIWCIQVFVLNNRSWVTMKTSARKKKEKVVLLPPKTTLFYRVYNLFCPTKYYLVAFGHKILNLPSKLLIFWQLPGTLMFLTLGKSFSTGIFDHSFHSKKWPKSIIDKYSKFHFCKMLKTK